MKKILTMALVLGVGFASTAQTNDQIQNKKGVDLLPTKGDFAIGLGTDVGELTRFFGNMFNDDSGNEINDLFLDNTTGGNGSIFAKYMISDNQAIRASFYNSGSESTQVAEVFDDRSNDPDSVVYDRARRTSSTTQISLGLEWRRGKSRVRGFYGVEGVISWNNFHRNYSYGNALSTDNLTPSDASIMPGYNLQHGRTVGSRNGATFGIGARGFAGIEYFIAPRIAIGTEFGWGVNFSKTSDRTVTYEKYDPFYDNGAGGIVSYEDRTNQGGWSINSAVDNFNSQIFFNFYF